jgi:hypothetical protein
MPQPPSPPFVPGAMTSPRQLNRWIDINPQGGALERIKTFLSLPAFSQIVNWKGYSEIVVAFNFEGPNNFSLRNFPIVTGTNYALAIMWVHNTVTHRYWLISGVGEIIYFPQIPYTGQVIEKNFRLEVWSTNSSPAISTGIPIMRTSVLGDIDYMWGTDINLVIVDIPSITNFQNIGGSPALPTDFGIIHHFLPSGISAGNNPTWTDSITVEALTNVGIGNTGQGSVGLPVSTRILLTNGLGDVANNFTADNVTFNTIAIGFRTSTGGSGDICLDTSNDNELLYTNSSKTVTLKNQTNVICSVAGLAANTWYVAVLTVNTLYIYNMSTGILVGSSSGVCTIGTATTFSIGGMPGEYVELILGTIKATATDAQNIANYFTSTYFSGTVGVWTLPLIFPSNSVPVNN